LHDAPQTYGKLTAASDNAAGNTNTTIRIRMEFCAFEPMTAPVLPYSSKILANV
jgi:hypothetical protein